MKEKGHIIIDNQFEIPTYQCCHCGSHFIMKKGSGITRGFCTKCMGPTCGSKQCDICIPYMKKIEMLEK